MKNAIIMFSSLIFSLIVYADDWETKFQEVCKIDNMCSRLKSNDGTWLKPKPEIIALLQTPEIKKQIETASRQYGVSSSALAGAILAENSLNVGVKDQVQTWLAQKLNITSVPIKGSFSFGLGQIQLPAAREAENYLANIEKRAPKSDEQLTQEIANPEGSIRIAATIIRKVQDDYKSQGFDISNQPGVLASLYNLGKSEERAKKAKEEGRLPRTNYFGLFVDRYSSEISGVIKSKEQLPVVQKTEAPKVVKTEVPITKKVSQSVSTSQSLEKSLVSTRSIPLVSSPKLCGGSSYGQDVMRDTQAIFYGDSIGVLDKGEPFSVSSTALDCDSKPWKLVKTKSGAYGWVKDDELTSSSKDAYVQKTTCENPSNSKCSESINDKIKDYKSSDGSPSNTVYMKPVLSDPKKEATFSNEDFSCGYQIPQTQSSKPFSGAFGVQSLSTISKEEMRKQTQENYSFVNSELKKMSEATKIPVENLADPQNPYNGLASSLIALRDSQKKCLSTLSAERYFCNPPNDFKEKVMPKLAMIKYKAEPSYDEAQTISTEIGSLYYLAMGQVMGSFYQTSDSEISSVTADEIRSKINNCKDKIINFIKENESKLTTPQTVQMPYQMSGGTGYGMYIGTSYGYTQTITYPGLPKKEYIENYYKSFIEAPDTKLLKYSKEFISYSKMCQSKFDLLQDEPVKSGSSSCNRPDLYLSGFNNLLTKKMIQEKYKKNPFEFTIDMGMLTNDFLRPDILADINPDLFKPIKPMNQESPTNPYCPNKTAEYIENLIKENPCITHVFVPTKFLAQKLGSMNGKVVYRKFDKDGLYAIETGAESCK